MKQRYLIIERYFGKFLSTRTLAATDDLHKAVCLIRLLRAGSQHPCYYYDFKKIAEDLDPVLDWFPSNDLSKDGKIIKCINYDEFITQKP